jgi:Asp-tRNA(Asn)/Glu-tRNA(Gln) amidotransferase A subunit family amidase
MQAVAKPDGRDMSVTELPFNWNADFDIRTLKVGIIQDSFDEITDPAAKANAQKTLETLKAIGVRELVPVSVPDFTANVSAISVESAVFFDKHARAGRMKGTRSARPSGRLVPAVEWLQSQRVRTMMMMELAKATAHVDVYIVGSNNTGMGGPGGGRTPGASGPAAAAGEAGGEGGAATPRPADPPRPQTPSQRHFAMANLACYPAINLPNGFAETLTPTNATIYAQPYRELQILALAKAYQDAAKHHLVKPAKLDG